MRPFPCRRRGSLHALRTEAELLLSRHTSPLLAELVCSNSFRSDDAESSGVGLLKREMRDLGSAIMRAADQCAVPAGKALAVDRDRFAALVTRMVEESPQITLVRRHIPSLDAPELEGKTVVVAAGPLGFGRPCFLAHGRNGKRQPVLL